MRAQRPPAQLPRGYEPVWKALHAADQEVPSRQKLARRLGVATHTLQKILVDGDVPRFPETTSRRVVHAWVRTLTRLADLLGAVPRAWVEGAGIPWTPTVEAVSEAARTRPRRAAPDEPSPARRSGGSLAAAVGPSPRPGSLRVGLADSPPFSSPLLAHTGSFLSQYTRRLIGAVVPSAEISFHDRSEEELAGDLSRGEASLDLAAGVLETVARRARGIEFLPIPGWRVRLAGLTIRDRDDRTAPARWSEATSAWGSGRYDLLVSQDGVARDHVLGQCAVPADRLLVRAARRPEDLAELLFRESQRSGGRRLVLVAEDAVCRGTAAALRAIPGFAERREAVELAATPGETPSYPLCIAWRSGSLPWETVPLRLAQEREIFGSSYALTADLYADLLAAGWFRPSDSRPQAPLGGRAGWTAVARLDPPHPEFETRLCRRFVAMALDGLAAQTAAEGDVGSPDRLHATVTARVRREAPALFPGEWAGHLEAALGSIVAGASLAGVSDETAPRAASCLSCSAFLADGLHGGVSDRYCRFCSDESGALKPRGEVEALLARWIAGWHGHLSEEDSRASASRFMAEMPAWSGN